MIGVVLVTHGNLATSFKSAVEHVVGAQEAFETICIDADDDMDARRSDIIAAVKAVDQGRGVIIVTDMFGGTPCNLAISILDIGSIEVLAGMNLPMLIKLARARETGAMAEVLESAQEAGKKYINVASQVLTSG
ncbi:MAG: PTS sugar transporter subunit IIA [Ahrensia sp.]